MNSKDILDLFLILGVITFTGCVVFLTFFLIQALKAIKALAEELKETTEGLKDKAGLKVITAIPAILLALLGRVIKRGR